MLTIFYIPEALSAMRENNSTYSSAGRMDWQEQKKVIANIIRLIKSPQYQDVFPYFVKGNIMAHFGDDSVKAIIEYPELWDVQTKMLIQNQLNNYMRQIDSMNNLDMFNLYYLSGVLDHQTQNWHNARENLLKALNLSGDAPSARVSEILYMLKEIKNLQLV